MRTALQAKSLSLMIAVVLSVTVLALNAFSAATLGMIALIAGGMAVFLLRQTTLRGRREERLAAEKQRAVDAEGEKNSFLTMISHEIRNLLNAILGFSELLKAEATTEKQRRYTESILSGGRSLLQLANAISELSKIGGKLPPKTDPAAARDAADSVRQRVAQVDFNALQPSLFLVADDQAANLELMRGTFENTHHRVQFASGGMAALQAAQAEKPDLVLMDLQMPDMEGTKALRLFRSDRNLARLPVIAITASALSAEELGSPSFDGYVRKPFSRAELYREIAKLVPKAAALPVQPESADPGKVPTIGQAPRWRQLTTQLRELKREVWPGVRDGMVMSEVRRFANGLQKNAVNAAYPPLEAYAFQLLEDADSFAISTLQRHLSEFPQRIAELDRSIAAA